MKKYLAILLVLCLTFTSMFACSNTDNESGNDSNDDVNVETPSDSDSSSDTPDETDPDEPVDSESDEPVESPTESETEEPEEEPLVALYDRVVLIGVDGAGSFFQNTPTPNIDKIFANGAVTYTAQTATPSISAQSWGSLLLGVTPDLHRLTNGIVGSTPYDVDSIFPSIFRVIRENDPDAVLASFCNWNPINVGIIEDNLGVIKDSGNDAQVTKKACDFIAQNDPKLLFVHFDQVDGAGHGSGYGSSKHLNQITISDGYIGQIYNALEQRGFLETTLFIVTADHGGTPGGSHGGSTPEEMNIMYAAIGHNIVPGGTIPDMQIRDNASIIMYALGYKQPSTWTSRIPGDFFVGVDEQERPEFVPEPSENRKHENEPTPTADSGEYLTDFISSDRVLAYLTLDGNETDALGKVTTAANNKIYYIEGYYGEAAQLDDGYISINDYAPGNSSFTLSFWFKTSGVSSDPCLVSNKKWQSGGNPGYVLSLRPTDVKFNLGNGSSRMDTEYSLPLDFYHGWVHVILAVDRDAGSVSFWYDFSNPITTGISDSLKNVSFDSFNVLNLGQDGTGNYSEPLTATMDEFIIFDGAFTQGDVDALAAYYKIEK
ncbi:MAG: hypothetical protein E7672_00185 [Ruminococcaceae bacterium]|nr:hypothetical protein [Oscillospiraceae bacterium]